MATLSPEDFSRLQNQLLELREKNYGLEDSLRKNKKELSEVKARLHALEEENGRYQTLIRTSKKASEVELLMRDNSYLRNKLKDQEEDFRLQSNTLLKELSKLVGESERYERQMEILCGKPSCELGAEGDHGCTDDSKEVMRLRGELKQMEQQLYEAETQVEAEKEAHTEKVNALNLQVTQLTHILQIHSIPLDEGEINLGKGGGVSFKKLHLQDDDGLESNTARTDDVDFHDKANQLHSELERMRKELQEEKERTAALTSEKAGLEERLRSTDGRLASAVEEAEQREKERQILTNEAEEGVKKEEEQHRIRIEQLQASLEQANSTLSASESKLDEKSKHLDSCQHSLEQLEHKLETTKQALHDAQSVMLQKDKQCEGLKENVNLVMKEVTSMKELIQETEEQRREALCKVSDQETEISSLKESLEEQKKLAESHHRLVEEMKLCVEDEKQKHTEELQRVTSKHQEEADSLNAQNQQLKNELEEINHKLNEVTVLNTRVTQLEEDKTRLEEVNEKLLKGAEDAQRQHQEETDRLAAEKCQEFEKINDEWQKEKNDLQTQLEISAIQRQEAEESVEALKRKVADGEEEQRIHERKGVTLMKDLKKQLTAERKRADRLQEKLSQLLTDPAQLTAITTVSDPGDDVSSVSSWSMVSGEPRDSSTRENSIIASPQDSPPPGTVSEETVSLVNRVTELQQHKWQLEERITHLEASSAAMADDILKKSAVIQHFCMEHKSIEGSGTPPSSPLHSTTHADKPAVLRVLEMVRGGPGEESLREVNRRLQNLLEETLGKNMLLHKDVDNLSQQVHELSKLAAGNTETEEPRGKAALDSEA